MEELYPQIPEKYTFWDWERNQPAIEIDIHTREITWVGKPVVCMSMSDLMHLNAFTDIRIRGQMGIVGKYPVKVHSSSLSNHLILIRVDVPGSILVYIGYRIKKWLKEANQRIIIALEFLGLSKGKIGMERNWFQVFEALLSKGLFAIFFSFIFIKMLTNRKVTNG